MLQLREQVNKQPITTTSQPRIQSIKLNHRITTKKQPTNNNQESSQPITTTASKPRLKSTNHNQESNQQITTKTITNQSQPRIQSQPPNHNTTNHNQPITTQNPHQVPLRFLESPLPHDIENGDPKGNRNAP